MRDRASNQGPASEHREQLLAISKGGQVSVPANLRRRWRARQVWLVDEGDRAVLYPLPQDPIDSAAGSLKGKGRGLTSDELRDIDRREGEQEDQKYLRRRGVDRP
jgi:hypothetical protein